ncbi:family 10 glycosylhydrolase [Flavobacterium sp. ST-87]|uniref:Family 10 glycosylhydrolase n=1 Tax=Flavobacterium plantiphilum TaxID=3163297 RepID=A0ABW8XQ82_9FLAO
MNRKLFLFSFISFLLASISVAQAQFKTSNPKNEFRAVWIATVANIDWPVSNTDAVEKQKADFIEILDAYKKLNYNVVIVQIRSAGDAMYPTNLAPWSKYLTGKQGLAPYPFYDPLDWMIAQAHQRGFEFHAWLNPYRATMDLNIGALSRSHDVIKHPEWMIKYGGKYYYNPALPEVQTHLMNIVDEVVTKYDVDAIHFDDYFYPYRIKGEEFNDTAAYRKYGNGQSREDWRRDNVNTYVQSTYNSIKKIKPWVQFGISPFGVWRNKSVDPRGSDTQAGQTNYDDLYADPMTWMEGNYIDYLLPQLYWSIEHKTASYAKLAKWWSENTNKNTALYIGNGSYKINSDSDKKWFNPNEIPNQIDLTRTYPNINGNAFFSAKWFVNKNQAVTQLLKDNQYQYPALPYVVPNSRKEVLDIPCITNINNQTANTIVTLDFPTQSKIRYVIVYGSTNKNRIDVNNPSQIIDKIAFSETKDSITITIPKLYLERHNNCAVTFVDYFGNESQATLLKVNN